LLEEEKMIAFYRWLEASLATADIRVSPQVKDSLLSPQRMTAPSSAVEPPPPGED
jgi:hypothetical protein